METTPSPLIDAVSITIMRMDLKEVPHLTVTIVPFGLADAVLIGSVAVEPLPVAPVQIGCPGGQMPPTVEAAVNVMLVSVSLSQT